MNIQEKFVTARKTFKSPSQLNPMAEILNPKKKIVHLKKKQWPPII